jgi:hypothetical protein
VTREQTLEEELKFILTLLDWGSLDGPQFQAYWRAKLLVGTEQEQNWARRKLGSLWRCEDHSPRKGEYNGKPFLGFSPYENEMRDGDERLK